MVGSVAGTSGTSVAQHGHRRETIATLKVRCFGHFALMGRDGWVLGPSLKKGQEFLAYLVTHSRSVAPKNRLIDAFWPGVTADEGSHRLHLAVSGARSTLRTILPFQAIDSVNGGYAWNPRVRVESDLETFLSHAGSAAIPSLQAGVALYGGELLSAIREEWIEPIRLRCSSSFLEMLLRLAEDALAASDYPRSLEYGLRIMEDDPGHEAGARTVMTAFAAAGRRSAALMHYEGLRSYLQRHFGVEPMRETVLCWQAIREGARLAARP